MTISSVPEVLDINHIGQSGVAAKRMHTFLTSITSTLGNISSPFSFKGSIAVNTSFPLLAAVQTGWFYTITAAVTDNAGATYTNTGQYFTPGAEIAWNGTNWTELGSPEVVATATATPITVGPKNSVTFVDTATIAAASAVALPAATAAKAGDKIAIYDSTGSAETYNITVTPNTTNTIDGVNAAVVIARAYGALVLQCVGLGAWKTLYSNILPSGDIYVKVAGLNMMTLNQELTGTLSGTAGHRFIPTHVIVKTATVTGTPTVGQITVGTAAGGTQVLTATAITGCTLANDTRMIPLSAGATNIAGNATIYVKCTTATTVATVHTVDVWVRGFRA